MAEWNKVKYIIHQHWLQIVQFLHSLAFSGRTERLPVQNDFLYRTQLCQYGFPRRGIGIGYGVFVHFLLLMILLSFRFGRDSAEQQKVLGVEGLWAAVDVSARRLFVMLGPFPLRSQCASEKKEQIKIVFRTSTTTMNVLWVNCTVTVKCRIAFCVIKTFSKQCFTNLL